MLGRTHYLKNNMLSLVDWMDDTKPKKAKKAEEVTEDEEEDIDLDAFDDAPPPKKNAAKKDVPK